MDNRPLKRRRSLSPSRPSSSKWHQNDSSTRHSRKTSDDTRVVRSIREQTKLNSLQEAEQARKWVEQEDTFVLKQAKKKAEIRVKEGRAKPIDWLAVNLRVIDRERDPLDDEIDDEDLDVVDPESLLEGLGAKDLEELEGNIDTYISLERNKINNEFWRTMKVLCSDRREKARHRDSSRAVASVASDVDKLFSIKSLDELQTLEVQITKKLNSDEPIDVDYWGELLKSLRIWKAKASLKQVYSTVVANRLEILRRQQRDEAGIVRKKLEDILTDTCLTSPVSYREVRPLPYSRTMDPEPLLKLRFEDKGLRTMTESDFLHSVTANRIQILKMGYVPHKTRPSDKSSFKTYNGLLDVPPSNNHSDFGLPLSNSSASTSRFATVINDDFSTATLALYEREVARGVSDNEEIFTGEETLPFASSPSWASKHRPRKPRYFNRVQMGYEWNKYNQTHYDHDNPPPKVVQGYKFNIFYPDLIDKSKAPTYKIEREGGRKRGQSFAPAGEEDTCLIRFIAGPPYEDIAFRIVDKEWDYSAKRERGFRSSFEKGILQLHFQLKKIYYRK